ncbi:dephospho-CoA kinase, partial [Chloroflexi bacterium]|nr:dephospho-CoA kinase [Chloroflexota bacterium]
VAIERLKSRNNFSHEEASQRLLSQKKWQDRAEASDIVTLNNGTIEDLEGEVVKNYKDLKDKYSKGLLEPSKYLKWWATNSS